MAGVDPKSCCLKTSFLTFSGDLKVSNEQNPGSLGYIGDEILPIYIGIIS